MQLLDATVKHCRFGHKINSFSYKSTFVAIPITKTKTKTKTKTLASASIFFSIEKFNLFSFYGKDYQFKSFDNLDNWLHNLLKQYQINSVASVMLVAQPRYLGYVFNPVSFWLCYNNNQQLIAVIAEVNNRSKQTHIYVCRNSIGASAASSAPITNKDKFVAAKQFFVSPFLTDDGDYHFQFNIAKHQVKFFINLLQNNKVVLTTSLVSSVQNLTSKLLLKQFFKIPFSTLKTTLLIHYQALKLFTKGYSFRRCPPQSATKSSRNND